MTERLDEHYTTTTSTYLVGSTGCFSTAFVVTECRKTGSTGNNYSASFVKAFIRGIFSLGAIRVTMNRIHHINSVRIRVNLKVGRFNESLVTYAALNVVGITRSNTSSRSTGYRYNVIHTIGKHSTTVITLVVVVSVSAFAAHSFLITVVTYVVLIGVFVLREFLVAIITIVILGVGVSTFATHSYTTNIAHVVRILIKAHGNRSAAVVTHMICRFNVSATGVYTSTANITRVVLIRVDARSNRSAAVVTGVLAFSSLVSAHRSVANITLVILRVLVLAIGELLATVIALVVVIAVSAVAIRNILFADITLVILRIYVGTLGELLATTVTHVIRIGITTLGNLFATVVTLVIHQVGFRIGVVLAFYGSVGEFNDRALASVAVISLVAVRTTGRSHLLERKTLLNGVLARAKICFRQTLVFTVYCKNRSRNHGDDHHACKQKSQNFSFHDFVSFHKIKYIYFRPYGSRKQKSGIRTRPGQQQEIRVRCKRHVPSDDCSTHRESNARNSAPYDYAFASFLRTTKRYNERYKQQ